MRLLTFSFLKNSSIKRICSVTSRMYSDTMVLPAFAPVTVDPRLVELAPTWESNIEPELRATIQRDMQIYPNFITEQEEAHMLTELEPQLKRMRYEFDHWDNAIHGFRETERSQWLEPSEAVLARVRSVAFVPGSGAGEPLPHMHVLDLAAAGYIKPHVDAVRFCGEVIAGLCLVSSAVMHLEHTTNKKMALHALLAQRSLYIMRGAARYLFTHAVLGGDTSLFRGEKVPRKRRVAVICRSRPKPEHASDNSDPVFGSAKE